MSAHSDAAEAAIQRLMDSGFTRAEATLEYVNSLRGPNISFEDVDRYDGARADEQKANGEDKAERVRFPKRQPIRWPELSDKQPPDRIWLVDQWLTTGVTLIAGPGGTGKSLLAQTLATALAIGQPYLDAITGTHSVLYWACEDERDELWRRQLAICRHFGADLPALPDRYVLEPRLGRSNGLTYQNFGALAWTELYGELREQVNDYHAAVLILDNIGQVFGGNENDRHHVTEFLNGLLGLTTWPLAILLLGHPAKATGSEYSGSTAWQNAVRMRWYMGDKLPDQQQSDDEEQADPNVRYIAKRKANYTAHDYRKLLWTDGLYVPEVIALPRFDERYGGRKDGAEAVLLAALDQFGANGVRCTASSASSDYLPRLILTANLAKGYTSKELNSAMQRLRAAGTIGDVKVGEYPNRTPKYGLGCTNARTNGK